jgi:hypothetical protein
MEPLRKRMEMPRRNTRINEGRATNNEQGLKTQTYSDTNKGQA